MIIIAKTKDGYLIHATKNEIKEILTSVTGERPDELKIGQKIPAIDYASTITKVKSLSDNYSFKQLLQYADNFHGSVIEMGEIVNNTKSIEI